MSSNELNSNEKNNTEIDGNKFVYKEVRCNCIEQFFDRVLCLVYPRRCPFCQVISRDGICVPCKESIKHIKEPRCFRCGKPITSMEQEFCRDCEKSTFAYEQGRSLYLHHGRVANSIYQFKFFNKRLYGMEYAVELANVFRNDIKRWDIDLIIPIPLHFSKERQRGYNQSDIISKYLGRELNIPVNYEAVFRVKKTQPQKNLTKNSRLDNLTGAFGVSKKQNISGNVLLIDDIYTTGITIHKVAKVLKTAGAAKVYFLTVSIGQET